MAGFGHQFGLDKETAVRLGRGLGMGLGQGLTCGAVSGAIMVLGLAEGPAGENDREARYRCYEQVEEFVTRFKERHGFLACRDLLGVDMTTAAGQREARERGLFEKVCPALVRSAAEMLQDMLEEYQHGGEAA